jgi:hypothetical protein
MCVYKQGEKWWYEFDLRGHRVRASSRSTDKAVALVIEAEHRRSLELGIGGWVLLSKRSKRRRRQTD